MMLEKIKKELALSNTQLVAVSKTKPMTQILAMYEQEQRIFGENRVQEMLEKQAQLPKDIEWHMIGHLQRKKVKLIAPFVSMIHSVDNIKLLEEINKHASLHERVIPILLQFKIAEEETKYGFDLPDLIPFLENDALLNLPHVQIAGVMGMATFTSNQAQVRSEFSILKHIFTQLKNQYFLEDPNFKEVSMGMSGDYQIAIEEGSTMVRIGSLLFGKR